MQIIKWITFEKKKTKIEVNYQSGLFIFIFFAKVVSLYL